MASSDEDIRAWADRIAAELPPFTDEEARELGRLAARIDARRADQAQQTGASPKRAAA